MTERTVRSQTGLPRAAYLWASIAATIFLYLRNFVLPGAPIAALGDQMLFFGRAVHILHGKLIYRDVFELVTPGTDLLYAALFKVFGIHAWVMSACTVAVGLTGFLIVTSIAAEMFQGMVTLLPGFLFLIFDFNSASDITHHWYSTLAALASARLLMRGTGPLRSIAAASLCALSVLFTQTQGSFAFIALLAYLVWKKRSESPGKDIWLSPAAFVLSFAAIVSGVLGYYAYMAGPHVILFDLVEFPLKFLSSGNFNSPRTYLQQFPSIHSIGDIYRAVPFVFIYALVPYVYLAGLYQLWSRRGQLRPHVRDPLILLHMVGIALFLAVASGPRFFRLCTVAPPAILVCVWLLNGQLRAVKLSRNLLWIAATAFAIALSIRRQVEWHGVLDLPIGRTAFTHRQEYNQFQWLAQHTHPGDRFFNSTAVSLFLQLETPTLVELINDEDFTRPEQVTAVINWLQQQPAKFIVMYPESDSYSETRSNSARFRRYVAANYQRVQVFPLFESTWYEEVWEPKLTTASSPEAREWNSDSREIRRQLPPQN